MKVYLLFWFWWDEGHDYQVDHYHSGYLAIVDTVSKGKAIAEKVAQETLAFTEREYIADEWDAVCSADVHYRMMPYTLNELPEDYPKP